MSLTAKVLFLVVAIAVLAIATTRYVSGWRCKPVRGTLRVPQGKARVKLTVCDDRPLRPFKYGQVFDATFLAGEQGATCVSTGERRTGIGAIAYRGTTLGFADASSARVQVLAELARRNHKVVVPVVVSGLDVEGNPVIELLLPGAAWFQRAVA